MSEDMDGLRRDLLAQLPARIQGALDGYHRFTADPPPTDAKAFAAWHSAAKAALAHVEGLMKLTRWAEGKAEEPPQADDDLLDLLSAANRATDSLDDEDME